jgi:hypothetical protein
MVNTKEEFDCLPGNITKLKQVTTYYNATGLPGCVGSMDVVHVKWANFWTGYLISMKGKEEYPTLSFHCLTNFNHRVLAIYGPQFGSQNNKDIVI